MSGYSKFKILYIIRSYDERSGQKIAKSLAGKDICSDLTFRDAHAISAVDDIHEWTRDCLRSFFLSESKVAAVYSKFANVSTLRPYIELARNYDWIPFVLDCRTHIVPPSESQSVDQYKMSWDDIWLTEFKTSLEQGTEE